MFVERRMVRGATRWLVLAAVACSSPEGPPGPAPSQPVDLGGQTGSPIGQSECSSDADCAAKADLRVSELAPASSVDWVLSRSVCLPSDGSTRTPTTCHCYDDRKNGALLLGVRSECDEVDRLAGASCRLRRSRVATSHSPTKAVRRLARIWSTGCSRRIPSRPR